MLQRDLAAALRDRLRALAEQRRRFEYRRLTILLRREGLRVRHKRVYRHYREEGGLAVRRRRRTRIVRTTTAPLPQSAVDDGPLSRIGWSPGRKFRAFRVMDAFSRRGLASEVDTSLSGSRVVQVLDRLADQRGRPEELVLDNGREFIGGALAQWVETHGVRLHSLHLASRSRTRTSRASTADSATRALNEAWFLSLPDARRIIEAWRQDYNAVRRHNALGYLTRAEFEQPSPSGEWERSPEERRRARFLTALPVLGLAT